MEYKIFESSDTNVKKFVFEFGEVHPTIAESYCVGHDDRAIAEAVLYKHGEYSERTVICCSVQSGCPVGCIFCGTGKFFIRNLTSGEIIRQVTTIMKIINCDSSEIKKFQIMFMSMGEPFLNYLNLEQAIEELHELYPNAQLLVSTSAPTSMYEAMSEFINLSKRIPQIGLQFSVHESTDESRRLLIPTKTSTLRQIVTMGEFWASFTGRKPFFNYCVHEGNSSWADANRLKELFDSNVWEVTLSVICEKEETVNNSIERQLEMINQFQHLLVALGFSIRVFNPAGQDDIGGGCGQLWYFQEWLKNNKQ